jgi:hypothetical protein
VHATEKLSVNFLAVDYCTMVKKTEPIEEEKKSVPEYKSTVLPPNRQLAVII